MLKGVLAGFLAYGLFSSADACIKAVGQRLPIFEILFFVTLISMGTFGFGKPKDERWRDMFRMNRPGLVAIRALAGIGAGFFGVYAFVTLPFAEAYSLLFLMPIFATLLSIPILGERVGWRRWLAVAIGFVGILLVVRPGFHALHLGHLAAAIAAVFAATSIIVLRILGPTEKRISLLGVVFSASVVVNAILMLPDFKVPSWPELGLLSLAGVVGGFGQIAMLAATRYAPPARVVPAQYSQMIWAVLLGAVFFGEYPDGVAFGGMLLVALSGLFTFLREEQLGGWWRRPIVDQTIP